MFAEKDLVTELLKDAIAAKNDEAARITEQANSSSESYKEKRELLDADFNNLTQISLEDLAEILSETSLSDEERELEFNYLKTIKGLLELNQTKKTTFQLSKRQIAFIEELKKQLKQLEKKVKEAKKTKLLEANEITSKIKELTKLLGIIEDPRSKEMIEDPEVIIHLMEEKDLDPKVQRSVLYSILRFNEEKYNIRKENDSMMEIERLNVEDVKDLFKKYSYDFQELRKSLQEDILNYGNLKRMEEVFTALVDNKFPHLDLKRNGTKLVGILLSGDAHTIQEAVEYSMAKGITPKDLLMIVPAMIEQAPKKKKTANDPPTPGKEQNPWISGRSEDYKKNIDFLESIGFKIDYIFKKCKEILVMSNDRLVSNYRTFIKYGFKVDVDEVGDLTHPALSCLLSSNFSEIVDQFIEICRDGHDYIKDNMSRICTVPSPDDLVFYNIYASYLDQDEFGESLVPEGPFNLNQRKLRLRGEITRYAGSGFEEIPYRGITEENKRQKTMTIEIDCQNKKQFDEAVARARGREGELYNLVFDDERILALEEFTDITNPTRYSFEGTYISKQKVERILNILKNEGLDTLEDSMLYAITYCSIMNQETFDKIKRIIRDRRK